MRVLTQRVTQQGDAAVQDPGGDVAMAPDGIKDLVAAESASWIAGQKGQYVEGLWLKRHYFPAAQQATPYEVDHDVIERQ